jgi:taurine dioxygenase
MTALTTQDVAYSVRRVGTRFGAEISGVDLTQGVDDATAAALQQELLAHKVLAFRGQHLTAAQHVAAVEIFGRPFDHPTAVRDEGHPLAYPYEVSGRETASAWHVGGLWRTPPFSLESLTFQAVPEVGGHTQWADLQEAYDDLSAPVQVLLESVSAVYDSNPVNYAQTREKQAEKPTAEHPVVLVHPETGRKGLFLSTSARALTGVTDAESRVLLPFLLAHASQPRYTIRFGWQAGDFAVWDNLAAWHAVVDDGAEGTRRYRKVLADRGPAADGA